MTHFTEDATKLLRTAMILVAGVSFLFSFALFFQKDLRPGLILLFVTILFGSSAYGLKTKHQWATHLSFILTALMAGRVYFEPGLLRSTVFPIFWLMILAVPLVALLESVQIEAWVARWRQKA